MNLALPHLSIKHLLPYLCVWLASLVGDFLTQFYYYRYCCLICRLPEAVVCS